MGPRSANCPKCDEDVTYTYQPYEPDVGIVSGGWFCEACDLVIAEEDDHDYGEF